MYTTILHYTNGEVLTINTPVLDDDRDLEEYLKETYELVEFDFMTHDTLTINI